MEHWKQVPSYPTYQASDSGRIRGPKGTELSQRLVGHYRHVTISGRSVAVAKLVAEAFHGHKPKGLQIDHVNNDKTDNRAVNLQYLTQSANVKKSYAGGTRKRRKQSNAFSAGQYARIRKMSADGMSQVRIAAVMGCSNSTISKILAGRTKPRIKTRMIHKPSGVIVKERINVSLSPHQLHLLQQASLRHQLSVSEYLRRVLDKHFTADEIERAIDEVAEEALAHDPSN